jgi:aspartate/methionine/tyrosine aminotransferase
MWARKDYTTIAPSVLCDRLAAAAMEPTARQQILARARGILTTHLAILSDWIADYGGILRFRPPDAGAIALIGYDLEIDSAALAERLRVEHSTLIVPGCQFGRENFFRIGFGYSEAHLRGGLAQLSSLLEKLAETRPAPTP